MPPSPAQLLPDSAIKKCPTCGGEEFFVRRSFPQKFGLFIVIAGAAGFLILAARPQTFRYGVYILAGVTLLDALLSLWVGRLVVCYRCRATRPLAPGNVKIPAYDLATDEKYRQSPPSPDR